MRDVIRGAAQWHIRQAYSDHAEAIYQQVATLFDDAAQTLTDAVSVYNPETAAELVANVKTKDQHRRAWADAQTAARKLDALLPALHAAATLASSEDQFGGVHSTGERIFGDEYVDDEVILLPLGADAKGLKRAAVWRAWDCEAIARHAQTRATKGSASTCRPRPAQGAGVP